MPKDIIQTEIIKRAKSLELTAYAISKLCKETFGDDSKTPSEITLNRYFQGSLSMSSQYVSQVCQVLGMLLVIHRDPIKPKPKPKRKWSRRIPTHLEPNRQPKKEF